MRFICINDGVPDVSLSLLSVACETRSVEYLELDAPAFAFEPDLRLAVGDMLYRPAISAAAIRVEQFLAQDGVASFYTDPMGPFFAAGAHHLHFQRLGLPTPRSIPVVSSERDMLRAAVAAIGGLPAVVQVGGWQRGVGTLRVDSLAALFSLVDLLLAEDHAPFLCAYIDDAVHWRLTVIGNRVVAAYRNHRDPDDFRTTSGRSPEDFTTEPQIAMADLAVRAVEALRLEFGGVDILAHESGRLYLLETNFPTYFAVPQIVVGIDVAGMMVEHLMAKSRALNGLRRA